MHTHSLLVLAVSSALFAAAALGQVERQHAPHVHGVATGNLAMDGGDLRLELEIPGVNLVGFEHAPRNDEQQAALDGALALLRAADWVQTDPRGGCEVASINAHTHGFLAHDIKDEHDPDHGQQEHGSHDREHSHDHEQSHQHGHEHHHHHDHSDDHHHEDGHSEFHIVVGLECQDPERLGWVDLRLFEGFSGNDRMDLDVLTDTLATQARLSPGNERITLR